MLYRILRNMFKFSGNNLLLLFFFFVIGSLLHFKGQTKPVADIWLQLKSAVGATGIPIRDESPKLVSGSDTDKAPQEQGSTDTRLERIISRQDFALPATRKNDQIVHHKGFSLKYIEKYEQAEWVAYTLTREQVTGQSSRSKLFLPDPKVKTGSAVFADYTRSGYDRGHLAPAADFKHDYAVMEETFYMSNISPQNKDFNAGIWNDLEKLVRQWAQRYERIYVVTGPVLEPGLPTIGRINRVAVPRHFYKVILQVSPPHIKGIAFILPNQSSGKSLSTFAVTIDEVENRTGIDFFPLLPKENEKKAEASVNVNEWPRLR